MTDELMIAIKDLKQGVKDLNDKVDSLCLTMEKTKTDTAWLKGIVFGFFGLVVVPMILFALHINA